MDSPKLPNFILAGAPTSGTTSLFHYLKQHPQVFMCPIKEPTFFASEDILAREDLRAKLARQRTTLNAYLEDRQDRPKQAWVTKWDDYVRLFRGVRDEIAIGEASVSYLWLPSAAPAIQRTLPGVRLVFMLRDPVERLFSAYLISLSSGQTLSFRDWVLQAMQSKPDRRQGMQSHNIPLDGGLYAMHLSRYIERFPREQIRIYLYESYRADANAVLRDIFGFIGVNTAQPIDLSFRHNETMVPRSQRLHIWRRRLLGDRALTHWLPPAVQRTLRGLYNRTGRRLTLAPEDRQLVVDYYRDELLRTQDLIGRDLSAWLR
jgi:hypothetical protein